MSGHKPDEERRRQNDKSTQPAPASMTDPVPSSAAAPAFSKCLDGVVFAISGVVNPERGELREKALEMGASYRSDWNKDCTLLLCAFPNTPKFKAVKAEGGTIVSKDWITECYKKKDLVDINHYMLFAGRPWRRGAKKDDKHVDSSGAMPSTAAATNTSKSTTGPQEQGKQDASGSSKRQSTTERKDEERKRLAGGIWFEEDLRATISWLQQQESKPEAKDLEAVASQGLLVCLEDTIQSLKENKGTKCVIEKWGFIPRAVKELQTMEEKRLPNKDILQQAQKMKDLYSKEVLKRSSKQDDNTMELRVDDAAVDEILDEEKITQAKSKLLDAYLDYKF